MVMRGRREAWTSSPVNVSIVVVVSAVRMYVPLRLVMGHALQRRTGMISVSRIEDAVGRGQPQFCSGSASAERGGSN